MTKTGTPILRTLNPFTPSDLKTTSVYILSDPPRLEAVHVYFPAKVISWASDEAIWPSWGIASNGKIQVKFEGSVLIKINYSFSPIIKMKKNV